MQKSVVKRKNPEEYFMDDSGYIVQENRTLFIT